MPDITYLDNAASAPILPEALEAMQEAARHHYANPSSIHALGKEARYAVEEARAKVAALVGADFSEVVFTSGATEANNLAVRGVVEPLLRKSRKVHAVVSGLEHASVAKTYECLLGRGVETTVIQPGKDGAVDPKAVLAAVRPETALVSVMAVNNEIGAIQPTVEIGKALHRLGGAKPLFHVDAVQAVVSMPFSVTEAKADLTTLSSHKIGGPKGVGALIVRRGLMPTGVSHDTRLLAILTGGGQENALRSGTENVPGIAGFAAAAARLRGERAADIANYEILRSALSEALEEGGRAKAVITPGRAAPHIAAFECPGFEADYLVLLLSRAGVMVSAGSACKSGSREASSVLKAIGLPVERARSAIRVSFGPASTQKDVDRLVDAFSASARVSPVRS
jgi:cysteine desulfurase